MAEELTPQQAACVYDRIGRLQDVQRVYEGPAVDQLVRWADLSTARAVYELGSGTGALAVRLLQEHLPDDASYRGVDVSPRMVRLARERLHRWAGRARVDLVDGSLPLPGGDAAYDRFLAAYVFDLFPDDYARAVLDEAARLLADTGVLAVVGLTVGRSASGRAVTRALSRIWEWDPRVVGGCRPIRLGEMVEERGWRIRHRAVVQIFGIAGEVVVAAAPGNGG